MNQLSVWGGLLWMEGMVPVKTHSIVSPRRASPGCSVTGQSQTGQSQRLKSVSKRLGLLLCPRCRSALAPPALPLCLAFDPDVVNRMMIMIMARAVFGQVALASMAANTSLLQLFCLLARLLVCLLPICFRFCCKRFCRCRFSLRGPR